VVELGTFPRMSRSVFTAVMLGVGLAVSLGVTAGCGNDNPKLLVTGIEPQKGADGTYVRIHGNRFTADGPRSVKVYFGGQAAQIDRFESDSELIVTAPGGKVNDTVDVLIVFDPGGRMTLPKAFRYVERNDSGPSIEDLSTNPNKKK